MDDVEDDANEEDEHHPKEQNKVESDDNPMTKTKIKIKKNLRTDDDVLNEEEVEDECNPETNK
jgi:hypothetical protein